MTTPHVTPPAAPRTVPKWARKRFVLPALALAFFIGIGAGAGGDASEGDKKSTQAAARSTVTATTTVTATPKAKAEKAEPEPADTVTVRTTKTAKATVTARPTAPLVSPPAGAKVSAPPLLVWTAVPNATYYNVQLWRRGRVLSAWPARTSTGPWQAILTATVGATLPFFARQIRIGMF